MNTDVVITYRSTPMFPTGDLLEQCITSLEKHTHGVRLIIVDDNSDEAGAQVVDRLARARGNALVVRTGFQRWFTKAVNLGLSLVRTERAVVLNSDCILDAGWLEELNDVWNTVEKETGQRVGLIGSCLSSEEPRRYAISNMPDYVTGHAWCLNMEAMHDAANVRCTPGRFLDETTALNIHIRSDVTICWELNKLGWQCVKSFKSAVGHIGGRSWGHFVAQVQGLRLEDVAEKYT